MVSIITPLYNSASFLERLTECLFSQTYTELEIILINDGSPDYSLKRAQNYQRNDPRIRIINKTNNGQSAALNDGIALATGEYLLFLDADDTLADTACERAVTVIEKYEADMVFWLHTREFRQEGRTEPGPAYFPAARHFKSEEDMRYLRRRMIGLLGEELRNPIATDYFNAGWGKLYRTAVIKENNIQWTDTKKVGSSDVLFNAELMPFVKSAYYLPEYLIHYTKDNYSSLTKTYGWSLFEKKKYLHQALQKVVDEHYSGTPEFEVALSNRRALSLINIALSVSRFPFHRKSITSMRAFLSNPIYHQALKKLSLKYVPGHYKVFFLNCRFSNVCIVLLLGRIMRILR
ncbi:MAG TPA: glycosyltransferase family 2 protein [Saprospiraceae bacterium]|nr:glycosyltransferase family 2 protein [Saprospiraceae bacterium]